MAPGMRALKVAALTVLSRGAFADDSTSAIEASSSSSEEFQKWLDYKHDAAQRGGGTMNSAQFDKMYQKYLDFQKYLKSRGKGGQSPYDFEHFVSEYNKYMDFQKYTNQGSSGSSNMDFNKFMDFEKYTKSGSKHVPAEYSKFMQDYQKFMDLKRYMNQQGGDSAGPANFQQYMNFQKYSQQYMNSGASSDASSSTQGTGFNFQQFMNFGGQGSKSGSQGPMDFNQFMDFSKYTKSVGGDSNADSPMNFKKYMDFNKYMGGKKTEAASPVAKPLSLDADSAVDSADAAGQSSSAPGGGGYMNYQQFMNGGMGSGGDTAGPAGGLGGVTSDFQKYMDYSKYMGISKQYTQKDWMSKWKDFQQEGSESQSVPYSATDCKTVEELKAWHKKQVGITTEWIPKQFQGPTLDSIKKDYETNMARLKHEPGETVPGEDDSSALGDTPLEAAAQPPAAQFGAEPEYLFSADKCTTVTQLKAWRAKQVGSLSKYVPKDYQKYSLAPIEAEYKKQLKRIQSGAVAEPTAADSKDASKPNEVKSEKPKMDTSGAQKATSVEELVAWRADEGAKSDLLPAEERAKWEKTLNEQLEDALARIQFLETGKQVKADSTSLSEVANAHPTRWGRTLMVCLLAFALPVAAAHVFHSMKQASMDGTDYDAQFIALDAQA